MRTRTKRAIKTARSYRKKLTPPEALLWSVLKGKKLGLNVRRQFAVVHYFLDFYIPEAKLCIEVDGSFHEQEQRAERDKERDELLQKYGIQTYRIAVSDLYKDLSAEVRTIKYLIAERSGRN